MTGERTISIPAFREEGDAQMDDFRKDFDISIPAFREEGDGANTIDGGGVGIFQSPPSVRKATRLQRPGKAPKTFQAPPSVSKATEIRMLEQHG